MRGEEKPELMHPQKSARFVHSVMIHLSCWWCLASCRDHCRCCSTPYISKHNIQRALKSFHMLHLLMISTPSGCSTVAIFSTVAIITHVWFQFTSICCLLCANKSKQHRLHASTLASIHSIYLHIVLLNCRTLKISL